MKHNLLYFYNKNFDIGPGPSFKTFLAATPAVIIGGHVYQDPRYQVYNFCIREGRALFLAGRHDTLIWSYLELSGVLYNKMM